MFFQCSSQPVRRPSLLLVSDNSSSSSAISAIATKYVYEVLGMKPISKTRLNPGKNGETREVRSIFCRSVPTSGLGRLDNSSLSNSNLISDSPEYIVKNSIVRNDPSLLYGHSLFPCFGEWTLICYELNVIRCPSFC